jgi:hypothetical protein
LDRLDASGESAASDATRATIDATNGENTMRAGVMKVTAVGSLTIEKVVDQSELHLFDGLARCSCITR